MQENITNTAWEIAAQKNIMLFKKISKLDKANFFEYISVMVDGGVSITQSLESVESKISSVYFKEKIQELYMYIQSWDSFSKAMKKMPDIFTRAEVSIVESWEQTGGLVISLWKLSDDLKKVHNLRQKVKSSLTYPLVIFLFLFVAIIVVLIYVIPAIMPLFEGSNVELPTATKALIATSDFVKNNYWLLILFFASAYVGFMWYKTTDSWKEQIDHFFLHMPLVGKVYRNYILANVASNLWGLIAAGVSVINTLKLVWKSTDNEIYKHLFEDIQKKVSLWEPIVESMKQVDPRKIYFPADFTQMLSVGEKTASMEKISRKLNNQYEKEVEYSLANLTKWIEPLAILLAGWFVTWFAFAIFGAILQVTNTVG